MNNFVVLPILIPLLAGVGMFFMRNRIALQKKLALFAMALTLITAIYMVYTVSANGIQVLYIGGWEAPFGITLVADMLAGLLIVTAAIASIACLWYAFFSVGQKRERHAVYPLFMIMASGVNGAFLTGDIFNLFVFVEVILIASYVLMSLGGGKIQLRETIKYVLINMISSSIFVVSIAYLYSVTGTLNMAHLSERVAMTGQGGLMTTIAILFLIVFAIKSGLFLFFWLPGSYSAAPSAIAAIFAALLTKVGIYAIIRFFTLIFYHQPQITHSIMLVMATLTMILGAVGVISHWGIRRILAYNVVVSVGFVLFAVALLHHNAMSGAIYYLLHDIVAKSLLFILGGAIISIAGTDKLNDISGLIRFRPLLGWLFFIATLAVVGVPPLSGFIGKVMILQSGIQSGYLWITAIGLFSSFLVLYSLMKVFVHSFWGETFLMAGEEISSGKGALLPGVLLVGLLVYMGIGAEQVIFYIDQAADVLMNPELYIQSVLYSQS